MPISAILFGGRRATAVPLVTESFDWQHGVFLGASVASEKTAAADGHGRRAAPRPVRHAAVLRLQHGRLLRRTGCRSARTADPAKLPRIYYVNWFRKDAAGRFAWPGFGENSRVLKWIVERLDGQAEAVETPIGQVPAPESLYPDDLDISPADLDLLLPVDRQTWRQEADLIPDFFRRSATTCRRGCWNCSRT